jgi:hypothetical protein
MNQFEISTPGAGTLNNANRISSAIARMQVQIDDIPVDRHLEPLLFPWGSKPGETDPRIKLHNDFRQAVLDMFSPAFLDQVQLK